MLDGLPSESKNSALATDNTDFIAALHRCLNSTDSESSKEFSKTNFEALRPALEDRWPKTKVNEAIKLLTKVFPDTDSEILTETQMEGYVRTKHVKIINGEVYSCFEIFQIEFYRLIFKEELSGKSR